MRNSCFSIQRFLWLGMFLVLWPGIVSPVYSGVLQRVANTTIDVPLKPIRYYFNPENALGAMTFSNAVAMATPPGETNRLFVVERHGRIVVITNLAAPTRTVFLDINVPVYSANAEEGLVGLAFHPGYATNRYFFVFYTTQTTTEGGSGRHDRLSRFQVSANANVADPNSEVVLFSQRDQSPSHNGGDLHFGPDGYLYVSLGDEGDGNDQYENSQRIDRDFFGGILRIDVDQRPGSISPTPHAANPAHYKIPPDNPFVGATTFNGQPVNTSTLRAEFWAVGLRNPWRMAFDPVTGNLLCGDVGQVTREEVNHIQRGGNYGWAFREGSLPGPRAASIPGGQAFINPIYEYAFAGFQSTNTGYCVIGGVFSYGTRLSQLHGCYIFGDFGTGNLWALRYDGTNVTDQFYLTSDGGICAFGVDPRNGDVLYIKMAQGTNSVIRRLVYNDTQYLDGQPEPPPPSLSQTGVFSDLIALTPSPGVVEYDINVPFWSDHATKRRWFSVPNLSTTIGFEAMGNWSLPEGSVWIKHFELELTNGVPASKRRLETRILVRNDEDVYGFTYRWGVSTADAFLVPEGGLDEAFTISNGGILRTQIWRYPARTECVRCHTSQGGYALGFNTAQLNRSFNYQHGSENQLRALAQAGYFTVAPTNYHTLPELVAGGNPVVSVESRVRSYLAANCAYCHQPGGSGRGGWDARFETPLSESGIVDGLLFNNLGDPTSRVAVPGSIARSALLTRLTTHGAGRMPPLGSRELDLQGIGLLTTWVVGELATRRTFLQWQLETFGSSIALNALAEADPDADGAPNSLEYLAGTNPLLSNEVFRLHLERTGGTVQLEFPRAARRGYEIQFSTNVCDPASWQVLDVPGNRPWVSADDLIEAVEDNGTNTAAKFYRVRVFEP